MTTVLRAGTASEAGLDQTRLDVIRERAAGWISDELTPALVLVAARHGVVALHEAFGVQNPEPDSPPLTVDSVFPCSSLCKPMTACALLILVEEGIVGLNQPVVDYLPELRGAGVENIRVCHLLTHTSGFDEVAILEHQNERMRERIDLPPTPTTQEKRIQLLLAARNGCAPTHAPDQVMSYCTHGFDLVGEIIRRESGRSLEGFMSERIFDPLGMADSSYRLEARHRDRIVKRAPLGNPYGADLNDERYLDMPWGGSALNTVALDVARFGQALLNGGRYGGYRLLSRASVREMTKNQVPEGVKEAGMWANSLPPSYGYGCFIIGPQRSEMNGRLLPEGSFAHSGMGGTSFWVDPLNEVVGVFFSVSVFPDGQVSDEASPRLHPAMYQDMLTAAVMD